MSNDPAPWLDAREARAWRGFVTGQNHVARRIAAQLQRDAGLSAADYEILVNLSEADDQRMRPFELMVATQWEQSRLSHHLKRMEQRGLIARERCPSDQRGLVIALTDAGRAAVAGAAPDHVAQVRRVFIDAFTPEQLDQLGDLVTVLLEHIESVDTCPGECGAAAAALDDDLAPPTAG